MKYLDCIELLSLALAQLKKGQRDQVPLSKLREVQTLVTRTIQRLEEPEPKTWLMDVINALSVAMQNTAVQYLPNTMKETLVEGITNCLAEVCDLAWDYYTTHDVPENQDTLLRTIVEYHYCKGA